MQLYANLKLSVMRFKKLLKHLAIPQSMGSSGQNRPDPSVYHSQGSHGPGKFWKVLEEKRDPGKSWMSPEILSKIKWSWN